MNFSAVATLRSLLLTHELDGRLDERHNPGLLSRLAALYLPLLNVLIEVRSALHDPLQRRRSSSTNSSQPSLPGAEGLKQRTVSEKVASTIAGLDRLPITHHAVAGIPGSTVNAGIRHPTSTVSKELTTEVSPRKRFFGCLCCSQLILSSLNRLTCPGVNSIFCCD